MRIWELEGALRVVRALQPATRRFGYHLALGGGVLNKGESEKDLDLYFLPMGGFDESKRHDPDKMLQYLTKLWGQPKPLASNYGYGKKILTHYKHAVEFTRLGGPDRKLKQRVDCFIF